MSNSHNASFSREITNPTDCLVPPPPSYLGLFTLAALPRRHAVEHRPAPPSETMSRSGAPLRLAVLEADTPQPQTLARVGSYTAVFTQLFQGACDTATPPMTLADELTISGHGIVDDLHAYPALDDVDAILISGSRHNSFDNDPWILKLVEYTRAALATNRVRVVGVCFGHQILSRALGCQVGRNPKGWEVAVTDVELTPQGKEVFGLDKMRIHQMHTDVVAEFPSDAVALGSNNVCSVQAMYSPGRYIAVQGHPEFTKDIVTELLFKRHTAGVFSDELYNSGMSRVADEHDGFAIARGFLKFLKD
ncbi:class I glutamine [Cordyceps militaris]|uniref:Class I glutamine n=1 Tax=Cordyceps militaris TaxID=73501 RepID=A0A2H4SEI5_CORMI|nr:class I glutamine [Cordyceps militaris]